MAAVTIDQLRDSGRAILAAYAGVGTDVSEGAVLAATPAYEVTSGGSTRRLSGRRWAVTRTLRVWIYAAEVADVNDEAEVRAKFIAAEALLDPIADLFAENQNMRHNSVSLVLGIDSMSDNGIGLLHYDQRIFAGFSLEFSVTVGR